MRLAAVALSVLLPSHAAAQPFYLDPANWRTGLNASQRLPDLKLDERRHPGQATVIAAEEIRASGARTLQELLARHSQVNQFDTIGNAFQQTVDLRGFNGNPVPATAVYVDGARVNEPDFGQVNFQLIPLENVERVEILPGPSTLYGKNALAGVIHVTTRRGSDKTEGEVGASYGSFNRRKGWANAGGSLEGVDWYVAGTKELDEGYRRHSEASIGSAMAKLGWRRGERSDISVAFTRVDDRLQQPGSLTGAEIAADPDQNVSEVDTISRMNFLAYNQRQALPWGFSAALNGHLRERREHTPLNRGRSSLTESLSEMRTAGVAGQLGREDELWDRRLTLTGGAEYVRSEADVASRGTFGGFPFSSGSLAEEDEVGLYLQAAADLWPGLATLTAGLRYDESRVRLEDKDTPANGGEQAFHRTNPRVGLNLNPADGVRLYASYSEAFRVPTVNEITALGPFGDNILRPVKAKSWEAGGSALLGGVELRATAFWTDVVDEIYAVFDPTQGFGSNINIDRTRRRGVEWGVRGGGKAWEGYLNHTYTAALFTAPMTLDSVPFGATQSVDPGDSLPLSPRHRAAAGLTFRPAEGWSVSMEESCVGAQRIQGDEGNEQPKVPGWCVTNLGGAFERGAWRVFVKGFNVLDKRYHTRGILSTSGGAMERFLIPAAGIHAQAGVSWRFSLAGEERTASRGTRDAWQLVRRIAAE